MPSNLSLYLFTPITVLLNPISHWPPWESQIIPVRAVALWGKSVSCVCDGVHPGVSCPCSACFPDNKRAMRHTPGRNFEAAATQTTSTATQPNVRASGGNSQPAETILTAPHTGSRRFSWFTTRFLRSLGRVVGHSLGWGRSRR